MRRLYTREKYLKIEKDAYELFYGTLTFLPRKSNSAGLRKEKDRDERELRALNKILILSAAPIASLFISRSKMFFISRFPRSRNRF
jgi:hypothetical protein